MKKIEKKEAERNIINKDLSFFISHSYHNFPAFKLYF